MNTRTNAHSHVHATHTNTCTKTPKHGRARALACARTRARTRVDFFSSTHLLCLHLVNCARTARNCTLSHHMCTVHTCLQQSCAPDLHHPCCLTSAQSLAQGACKKSTHFTPFSGGSGARLSRHGAGETVEKLDRKTNYQGPMRAMTEEISVVIKTIQQMIVRDMDVHSPAVCVDTLAQSILAQGHWFNAILGLSGGCERGFGRVAGCVHHMAPAACRPVQVWKIWVLQFVPALCGRIWVSSC